jgi:hypothetical protein
MKLENDLLRFPFISQEWCLITAIPALRMLRLMNRKLEASLGCIARPCLKNQENNNKLEKRFLLIKYVSLPF